MSEKLSLPSARTVIKAVAAAKGILKGGEGYLTKYQMITLCERWLELTRPKRLHRSTRRRSHG